MRYLFVGIGSILLLGLSIWAIAPAPTRWLLTFAVGAPEISPWLIVGNLVFLSLGLLALSHSWMGWVTVTVSCLALILSASPLSQFQAANQVAQQTFVQVIGADYPAIAGSRLQTKGRSQPFVLADSFRGIATAPVRETPDIPFAQPDGVPLTLTLYQPAQSGTYPGIVMIYGGSWQTGSPAANAQFARYMANQGYVVWAISYRHAPAYQFPAQLEDVQTALEFLKDHAKAYETDAERIALLGRSAGAQLALLAAYQPGPLSIRAVVDYYGPIDLLNGYYDIPKPNPLDVRDVLETFLGGTPDQVEERYKAASPSSFVAPNLPPSLLIYGGKDHIVEAKFGQTMAKRLAAADNRVGFIKIPWADHAFDAVFNGVSNQLALYYTERFLAWALR
ncbi:alpha/beta hydrolase fold domain-containing protein [Nodosilinea sp. LEGE 07088]|uniref:alpha/beta hydrolase fold domain-containing protein n=1 Tax=Nodosilinea sp. LEGE 07088 TaxID=2777968 RepID=UPI001D136E37|nr:alpha/beta hydrolase fold domain-containing protein [Nodosilinea sp. LEGE 07088]